MQSAECRLQVADARKRGGFDDSRVSRTFDSGIFGDFQDSMTSVDDGSHHMHEHVKSKKNPPKHRN